MTITAHIIESDESFTKHELESGEALAIAGDQRVTLPDVAAKDADLAINDGDVLTISVDGQTLLLPGLVANIENETGSELTFADGAVVGSLGALLARASLPETIVESGETDFGMADLVREDTDGGDLFYLNDLATMPGVVAPPKGAAGEVLELGELVEEGSEHDALFGVAGEAQDQDGSFDQASDLWANTEFGARSSEFESHHLGDGDIFDLLLGADDGIS